jgi:hypothetical protein
MSDVILVQCEEGIFHVEIEDGDADVAEFDAGAALPPRQRPADVVPSFALNHVVDLDACGETVVLLLDRRPPLLVSRDRGQTWDEAGGGLGAGRAVAFGVTPEQLVYAGRNRLYLSSDGGRFWRALTVELPEIRGVAWG